MTAIPIYIINVHPLLINNKLVWDIFYLTESTPSIYCLRIYNIQLSFMVARLPGLTLNQFERYMKQFTGNLKTVIRTDLADAAYFNFGRNREYMEIFSSSPVDLMNLYKTLNDKFTIYYSRIKDADISKMPDDDQLFYRNTETPFRFTETTIRLASTVYNLSTKYNIPLIGGARLNTNKTTSTFPDEYTPIRIKACNVKGLNANPNRNFAAETVNIGITNALTKDETIDFKQSLRMISYDIETYTPDQNVLPIPDIARHEIFSIGLGVFNLNEPKPLKRLCIISKPFDSNPMSVEDGRPLEFKNSSYNGNASVVVKNEYTYKDDIVTDDIIISCLDGNPTVIPDESTYLIARNEKELLQIFIELLIEYSPTIITGFNTFGFDDNFVYVRMKMHGLTSDYLQCFTYYSITNGDEDTYNLANEKWFKPFMPTFRSFELKIDGEQMKENQSVRAWQVLNVDVYKMMLKEDPKRFTQYGRGNLDSMLEAYAIKNPFTKKPLLKTGLKYQEMFRRWDENENIYSIAVYCCQDAWITGTLLITRSKLADLIEMSFISNTSLSDSIYRADGVRVANSLLRYAYEENFALMDTIFEKRHECKDDKDIVKFGGKEYDHRTIVGGQVRNVHAGRQWFVVALDYSSMYPANKEASNVDSSSRVDEDMIKHPEKYGLSIPRKININDMYGPREIYYVKVNHDGE